MAPDNVKGRRIERLLFGHQTSVTKQDFIGQEIVNFPRTEFKGKPAKPPRMVAPVKVKNVEIMGEVKKIVPFSLFIKKNAILHCRPSDKQERYTKLEDVNLEEVRKTRPRVVMTPGVSLDEIEDPMMLRSLLDNMYEGAQERDLRYSASASYPSDSSKAPLVEIYAPPRPTLLPKLEMTCVPPGWRMESAAWDKQQCRGYCRPTREFWLNRTNDH